MKRLAFIIAAAWLATPAFAATTTNISPKIVPARVFELSSADIMTNGPVPSKNISNAGGCTGQNLSPAVNWQGEPAGTLSYALTMYDQDAPNGGFWHWIVYDIPLSAISLSSGASGSPAMPSAAKESANSRGTAGYTGPCPPLGDTLHRYTLMVYALNTTLLNVPAGAPAMDVVSAINAAALSKASIVGFYSRPGNQP